MGVPQYFLWLVQHFDSEVLRETYPNGLVPEYLFLDFNAGIHPASKLPHINSMEDIYQSVCNYLETIVKLVKPSKMIYIAIDGTCPSSKMKQQRFRRFKAVQDQREKDKIDRKFKCWKAQKFDYNMISPGTVFMKELTKRLEEFISIRWQNLKVVLDDASNAGEGEHKIMHYLRTKVAPDAKVVVYGLDSDLIFLTLLNARPNFCLFREKIFFGKKPSNDETKDKKKKNGSNTSSEDELSVGETYQPEFTYLDVAQLRRIVLSMMNPELSQQELHNWQILQPKYERTNMTKAGTAAGFLVDLKPEAGLPLGNVDDFDRPTQLLTQTRLDVDMDQSKAKRLILDYVALSLILGNDFLPHLPHLKIKEGGLNMVIEAYKEIQLEMVEGGDTTSSFLVQPDGQNYDYKFLRKLLRKLVGTETQTLKEHREAAELRKSKFKTSQRYRTAEAYDKAVMEWEYIENKYEDILLLGEPGWKGRYYLHYLYDDHPALIRDMCRNYLEGMVWILRYYQGTCPSWKWCYQYRVAPAASSLLDYIEDEGKSCLTDIKFVEDQAVSPEEQLLLILPPQSHKLLEPKFAALMTETDSPISFQYPTNFKIDEQGHRYRWECYPILPPVDPDLVHKVVEVVRG